MNLSAETQEHQAIISLGSNIRPAENLPRAIVLLREYLTVLSISPAWETPPVGMQGNNFLNAVVCVQTHYPANLLKNLVLRRVEALLGRIRTQIKYSPRTIDLDILIFDGRVLDPGIWKHPHLAVPLASLIPDLNNPDTGETLAETASRLLADHPKLTLRPEVLARY